ncbi:MAG TPA: DUF1552 domain-containing protein [Kofleriaceae bacterium]|jgi:hypothetical protein
MKNGISRRSLLRGIGGAIVGLPLLESMTSRALAAPAGRSAPGNTPAGVVGTKRFVTAFCGTVVGNDTVSNPGSYGALPTTLPASWKGLESVRPYVSVVSNLNIPVYNAGTNPTAPASAYNMQHGTTPATTLAGVTSHDQMPIMVNGETADQIAARALGAGSKLDSLQVRTQLLPYTGSNSNLKGTMSAKIAAGKLTALPPIASPRQLYDLLFTGVAGGGSTGGSPAPYERKASVLDLIAEDAAALQGQVGASDKARLEQHFDEIRALELRMQAAATGGGGGTTSGCMSPFSAPTDPPAGPNQFAGWSNETVRGQLMADMIAYALACDFTRAVSWMLSFDQVFLANALDRTSDMHEDSHNAQTRTPTVAANCNWHATLFARLVGKLATMQEGAGTVLDNTFLSLIYAESKTAHGRSAMRHVVAGAGNAIKLGQHIDGAMGHPGKIQIAGFQALGMTTTTLGELTGPLTQIQK